MIEFPVASKAHRTLSKRLKNLAAAAAVSALFAVAGLAPVSAGGETRTISLYHIHTGESLTVTYMVDGRYVPSAMKKINYLLRDWRKDSVINIDPRSIDLVWELHEDLGSHEPIHIVCGYRSAATNAFLHRIGRHVARESQHIQGKAIDFYFPDVPTVKIRNVALVRQVGGVGYYRSAGGPTGFLHVDSAHVRHWGPYISPSQMASIFAEGKRLVGRRLRMNTGNDAADTAVASADDSKPGQAPVGPIGRLFGWGKKNNDAAAQAQVADAAPAAGATPTDQADMADLSADASAAPKPAAKGPAGSNVSATQMASLGDLTLDASQPAVKIKPAPQAADAQDDTADAPDAPDAKVKTARVVPKPRFRPVEIMLAAAADMKPAPDLIRINAASAPPPSQNGKDAPSPVADSLGVLMQQASVDPGAANSGLGLKLRNPQAKNLPVIRPMLASAAAFDIDWWPHLSLHPDAAIRRDGKPVLIGSINEDVLPKAAVLPPAQSGVAYAATAPVTQYAADGKGDLTVNEDDKGDLTPN